MRCKLAPGKFLSGQNDNICGLRDIKRTYEYEGLDGCKGYLDFPHLKDESPYPLA